jgi:hypothetical protein
LISREELRLYLSNDDSVQVDHTFSTSGYRLTVDIPGLEEVGAKATITLTNDINPLFIQMFAPVSSEHLQAAIAATTAISSVGLGTLGESQFALRFTLFAEFSEPLAVTNGLRALAMGYGEYLKAGGAPT